MTPTGLPAAKKPRTNSSASGLVRSWSGFATPPGRTRPSYSLASTSPTGRSTSKVSPLSRWLKAWTSPASGASSSASAPASRTARSGSVSSTCSTPSLAVKKAIFFPCRRSDIRCPFSVSGYSAHPSATPGSRWQTTRPAPQRGAAGVRSGEAGSLERMQEPQELELRRYLRSQRELAACLIQGESLDQVAPRFLEIVADLLRWEAGAMWEVVGEEEPLRLVTGWSIGRPRRRGQLWRRSREIDFNRGTGLPGRRLGERADRPRPRLQRVLDPDPPLRGLGGAGAGGGAGDPGADRSPGGRAGDRRVPHHLLRSPVRGADGPARRLRRPARHLRRPPPRGGRRAPKPSASASTWPRSSAAPRTRF